MQVINDFIGELNTGTSPGLGKRLFQIWRNDIFTNGSTKDAAIQLDKKSIIWPIIMIETDITRTDNRFLESLDSGLYDEVVRLYQETEVQQLEFFQSETMLEIFDKRLAAVPINAIVIDKKIKQLEKVLKSIRQEISRKTKSDSGVIQSLYDNII